MTNSVEFPNREALQLRSLLALGSVVSLVLLAVANRYGYHRDELYFLQASKHLAFGYVDQPPLTPLLARLDTALFGNSLFALRAVSAICGGAVVVLTGLIAREFGARSSGQLLAAASSACCAVLLIVSHMFSTSTFDLLIWTALSFVVIRAIREGGRYWVAVGLLGGLGLQNKTLVAFLLVGLIVGVLIVGPRSLLRTKGPYVAGAIALVLWLPNLVWQGMNGWPQLELSRAIASGSSGTSQAWYLFIPFQFVMVSPLLVPIWMTGLIRLWRDNSRRAFRFFAVSYLVLVVVFTATSGKPYYIAGLYPVLLAAGAQPVINWTRNRATKVRSVAVGSALVLGFATSAVLMLPVVPVTALASTPIVTINYDAGETVGWPSLVKTVDDVYSSLPADQRAGATIFTHNYGEAGAIDRFGAKYGLPRAYSAHNSYADWGIPSDSVAPTIVVGYERAALTTRWATVDAVATIDNGVNVDNDEQGETVWLCRDRLQPWSTLWPGLRHLD